MKKKLIVAMLALTLLVGGGCEVFGTPSDQIWVVTSESQVRPECIEGSLPIDLTRVAPVLKEKFPEENFIMSKKECLIPNAVFAPVTLDHSEWDWGNLGGALIGSLKEFLPGLAGLEALLLLLFPRKRTHYASAAKSLATLHLKDTLTSLGKALGVAHSSEGTKEVFIEEKLEEKLEAKRSKGRRRSPKK